MYWIRNLLIKLSQLIRKIMGGTNKPSIDIISRSDQHPRQLNILSSNTPQIVIKETHERTSNMTGGAVRIGEVEVAQPDIGHGIMVKKQRKPRRCPICATHGRIIPNINGGGRWKCEACDSTFN